MSRGAIPKYDHWGISPVIRSNSLESVIFNDSPASFVATEDTRKSFARRLHEGTSVPMKRHVFGKGCLNDSEFQSGGVPQRPPGRKWPRDKYGTEMAFLCRFRFDNCRDLVGNLPGDYLLLFVRVITSAVTGMSSIMVDLDEDPNSLVCEWVSQSKHLKSCPPSVPSKVVVPECHGVGFRSLDFHQLDISEMEVKQLFKAGRLESDGMERALTLRAIARHYGTKIGGLPLWSTERGPEPGLRFLCCFAGVNPICEFPYPWANQAAPLDVIDGISPSNRLLFRGDGWLNIFLNELGEVKCVCDFSDC